MIFHILPRRDWEGSAGDAPVAVPGEDGYVHCCDEGQIADVRRRWFAADAEVVALAFDPTLLPAETRYEPGALGEAERFPHVYGALPCGQVLSVREV